METKPMETMVVQRIDCETGETTIVETYQAEAPYPVESNGNGGFTIWRHDDRKICAASASELETAMHLWAGTIQQLDHSQSEITSLRTELAATPQWRDKPTIPGVYFSSIRGVETLKQWDIDDWPNRYIKVRIFGPIPTDTSKETGE